MLFESSSMRLAIISNVGGYRWAGSEELWYATAKLNIASGGTVCAVLNRDLLASTQCAHLKSLGAIVKAWRRFPVHRLESLKQCLRPTFSAGLLGRPEALLVSCGSLPALCVVPGLCDFLAETKIPYLLLCQFNADCLPLSASERQTVGKLLAKAARTVFVSSANLDLARRQFGIPLADAAVIPNVIRRQLAGPLPFPVIAGKAHLASVARFETHWKGQDVLLETLATQKWRERDWELFLYGEGPDEGYLRRLVDFYGLRDRVVFAGYERDFTKIWSHCHLKILCSRGEGMSLAMLEAMMCGRPVVATEVGGVDECVQENITGFRADAATPAALDKALDRAWANRSEWSRLGANAHALATKLSKRGPANELLAVMAEAATILELRG
jgi:L-malate glycosyltransferase